MMASTRHLRDLLEEVQEPFVLQNYIYDKHTQLKQRRRREPVLNTHHHLLINKRKPISEISSFRRNLCKNACFFSYSSCSSYSSSSPDFTKSPLFHLYRSSLAKPSPSRNSPNTNALLVFHVPAKTAALLLEAALRIQKPRATHKPKTPKSLVSGFFGSIMKKISHRKSQQKQKEINGRTSRSISDITGRSSSSKSGRTSVKDAMNCDSRCMENLEERRDFTYGFSCSSDSRISSIWSESNEFETSSSGSGESSELEFVGNRREEEEEEGEQKIEDGCFCCCDEDGGFFSSPFGLALEGSWSPDRRAPELRSPPATSPRLLRRQALEALEKDEGDLDCGREEEQEEEEEGKDQNSPVSVLDPPFEDDYNEGRDQDFGEDSQREFELEHSFSVVQRARHKLLHKLCRFGRLAELDPIVLEKKMVEEAEVDDDDDDTSEEDEAFIREVLRQSNLCSCHRIPRDMKRLVLDLMAKEEEGVDGAKRGLNSTNLVTKVCERLELWKEVEMNTIDMMVELDFRSQADEWKKNLEHVQEIAIDIELGIFGFLLEELSCELIHSS